MGGYGMSNLFDDCIRPSIAQLADQVNTTIEQIPYAESCQGMYWCPHCFREIYPSYVQKGISKCECGEMYQI